MEEIKTEDGTLEVDKLGEETPKKTNYLPLVGVVVAVLVVVGVIANKNTKPSDTSTMVSATKAPDSTVVQPAVGDVKDFTVDGSNFEFEPNTLSVNKGDTVKITFKDDDGMHNLVVDGYNVSTKIIRGGTSDTVTFTADKSGTFEYYCSVGSHREKGMTGTLVVQ